MKRKDEEIAKNLFDKFVRQRNPKINVFWDDVEQKLEPPDYYLHLDEDTYAVEVTQVMETRNLGVNKYTLLKIAKYLEHIKTEIESAQAVFQNGVYVLTVKDFMSNYSYIVEHKREFLRNAKAYIKNTQKIEIAIPQPVLQENYRVMITIEKVANNHREVMVLPIDFFMVDGVANEICDLISHALIEKARKLDKLVAPKILLLIDSYGFFDDGLGDIEKRRNCISTLSELLKDFHTVFWVKNEEQGIILHSIDTKWH